MNIIVNLRPAAFAALALLTLYLITALTVCGQKTGESADLQLWNEAAIDLPLSKHDDLTLTGSIRIGRSVSHLVDERIGLNFSHQLDARIAFFGAFTFIKTEPAANRRASEQRLAGGASFNLPFKKLVISNRHQFEYRVRSPGNNYPRYRTRIQADYSLKPFGINLKPFVGGEFFYDWNFKQWSRQRIFFGASHTLNKNLSVDLYFLEQFDDRAFNANWRVIGYSFKFRLPKLNKLVE